MKVKYESDSEVTDAACKKATGKTLKQWFGAIDAQGGPSQKRRDAINWLYAETDKDAWWSTTIWVEYERAKQIVNKKDGRIEGYNICVTKTVAAALADVYQAFVAAPHLRQWFGSSPSATVQEGEALADGDGNSGKYLRIRPNKDLRFTWAGEKSQAPTQVDIAFADKGKGKTGITLTHNRIQTRAESDGLRAAWGDALARVKTMLES